jgi:hypothetical protein
MNTYPKPQRIDNNDWRGVRHGRNRHEGFDIGQYINPAPMLFTRDGHNLWLADLYKGNSAFLILGGPSFGQLINSDKSIGFGSGSHSVRQCLNYPGVLTMGINNSVKTFRPNLWISVDDPTHFIKSIWLDPTINKFVPLDHAEKKIFDNDKWEMMDRVVGDCPNIYFYRRNEHFQHNQFLTENTFNWGNHGDLGGGRSVMLVAVRMLYYLGIRTIYLLGCDFHMDENTKYHFDQDRTKSSQRGNNSTYDKLIERFSLLQPIFLENNLSIYNCNPDSRLKVFPFISFEEAFLKSILQMPINIENERTSGLYERMAELKKANKAAN